MTKPHLSTRQASERFWTFVRHPIPEAARYAWVEVDVARRHAGPVVAVLLLTGAIAWFGRPRSQPAGAPLLRRPGASSAPTTARADLERTVASMEARLADNPGDAGAAVQLADVL